MKALTQLGILALSLAISTTALAQKGPDTDREAPMQRFADTLNLSEEQRNQMEALWEENREQRDARRQAMQDSRQTVMRERLSEILTPEQLEQMDAMRAKQRHEFRGSRRGGCDMNKAERAERREMRQERWQEKRQEQRQNPSS